MTSSNYYEPQLGEYCECPIVSSKQCIFLYSINMTNPGHCICRDYFTDDLQFPKVFTNNYFGSDENNLDEYDNIDCELLLEFFGTDNTGGQRGGYDTGSYNKHSSTFPVCSEDVLSPSLRNELSSTLEDDDKKTEPTKVSLENAMIKKEEMNGPAPKAKKQKISDGQQSSRTPFPAQQNQEQFASEKGESLQHSKVAITSKNSTSKIIQLEASKDRRRLDFSILLYFTLLSCWTSDAAVVSLCAISLLIYNSQRKKQGACSKN